MERTFNTGTIVTDLNGMILSNNHYVSYITERNPNDILGSNIEEIIKFDYNKVIKKDGTLIDAFFEKSDIYIDNEKCTLYLFWTSNFEIREHPILNSVIDNSFDFIQIIESESPYKIIYSSPSHDDIGLKTYKIEQNNFTNTFNKKHKSDLIGIIEKIKTHKNTVIDKFILKTEKGEVVVQAKFSPITNKNGSVNLITLTMREIDINKKIMEEQILKEKRLSSLFEMNPDMVFSLDENFSFTNVNESTLDLLKYTRKELMGKPLSTLISPDDFIDVFKVLVEATQNKVREFETVIYNKFGQKINILLIIFPIIINKETNGLYGIAKDITTQIKDKERMAFLANIDPLTKLPNRRSFNNKLSEYRFDDKPNNGQNSEDKETDKNIALMFFDLDNFKGINDNFGHNAGDELLKMVAERVKKDLPDNCYLSRISGDEFTIIIEDRTQKDLIKLAEFIKDMFYESFLLRNQDVTVSASFGIARYPEDAKTKKDLIRYADIAMYHSKKMGKNEISLFKRSMVKEAEDDFKLNYNLNEALKNEQFKLLFQPIVCSVTHKVLAAEALIRWNHPDEGVISPGLFIPIAETTGAIHRIGNWVIEEACKQINKWSKNGYENISISINISGKQLEDDMFAKNLKRIIKKYNVNPENIIIEITESIALNPRKKALNEIINNIKRIGCKLAIDDFGAGHSSLIYLKDFPVDYIKMDKTFMDNVLSDVRVSKIVKTIIDLSKSLNVKVIAEGIENVNESEKLRDLGSDYLQGYFFSWPQEIGKFEEEFLENK